MEEAALGAGSTDLRLSGRLPGGSHRQGTASNVPGTAQPAWGRLGACGPTSSRGAAPLGAAAQGPRGRCSTAQSVAATASPTKQRRGAQCASAHPRSARAGRCAEPPTARRLNSPAGQLTRPRARAPPPASQCYIEENTQFQLKVVAKSGLDVDGTYLPPAIHPSIAPEPKTDMKTAMVEAEMVMGGAVSDLLEKTGAFRA